MATDRDKDKKDAEKKPEEPKQAPVKNRKPLFLGGGFAALVAVAFLCATMAVPKKAETPELDGPFVAQLSKKELTVNLSGEDSKRYLVMELNGEYFAYDEAFVQARTGSGPEAGGAHGKGAGEDPQYSAMLMDALLGLGATKTRDEVTDPVMIDAFMEEVRQHVEPVLFPVVIGAVHSPGEADPRSGLRAGESMHVATMRGLLHDHYLEVDSRRGTLQLDEGEVVRFEGPERDLRVTDKAGRCVFVDVSGVVPDFKGAVPVGAPGKLRRVLRAKFLVQ